MTTSTPIHRSESLAEAVGAYFERLKVELQPAPATAPLREAVGYTVDADEHQWRRLSGQGSRDLDPLTRERSVELAEYLWRSNLLANRLIELPLAYLLAKGVRITHSDEKWQKVLDRHWSDGINAWDIKLVKRLRELSLFGEQCWPVFVGGNGFVRVGYLDPRQIATVVDDPDNSEQPIGVITKKDRKGNARRFRVIVNAPESVFTKRTQEIRQSFTDGDAFYWRVNDLCASTRGASDLLAQIDWLDAYEQFLFGEMERADFMRAFVWDVTLKGADPVTVQQRAREIVPPRPGSVRVHNDQESWSAVTPELQAHDGERAARLFRNHVLGGATVPEHWYGGGGDVNRTTAGSMSEPTEKMFEMRQRLVGHILIEVARFVLRAKWKRLEQELSEAEEELLDQLAVAWPEMSTKDTTRYAAAMQQLVSAVVQAIDNGLLPRLDAIGLIATVASQLGVEIDAEKALQAAAEERWERGGDELFGMPLETHGRNPKPPAPTAAADDPEA